MKNYNPLLNIVYLSDINLEPISNYGNPEEIFRKSELSNEIDNALDNLMSRERKILIYRFGFKGEEMTRDKIGKIMKVTPERIRQIEERALRKLRHPKNHRKLKEFY